MRKFVMLLQVILNFILKIILTIERHIIFEYQI